MMSLGRRTLHNILNIHMTYTSMWESYTVCISHGNIYDLLIEQVYGSYRVLDTKVFGLITGGRGGEGVRGMGREEGSGGKVGK